MILLKVEREIMAGSEHRSEAVAGLIHLYVGHSQQTAWIRMTLLATIIVWRVCSFVGRCPLGFGTAGRASSSTLVSSISNGSEWMSYKKTTESNLRCVRADVECNDPEAGEELLPGYVLNELKPARRDKMEQHLLDCPYCRLAVVNWQSLSIAIRRSSARRKTATPARPRA